MTETEIDFKNIRIGDKVRVVDTYSDGSAEARTFVVEDRESNYVGGRHLGAIEGGYNTHRRYYLVDRPVEELEPGTFFRDKDCDLWLVVTGGAVCFPDTSREFGEVYLTDIEDWQYVKNYAPFEVIGKMQGLGPA